MAPIEWNPINHKSSEVGVKRSIMHDTSTCIICA